MNKFGYPKDVWNVLVGIYIRIGNSGWGFTADTKYSSYTIPQDQQTILFTHCQTLQMTTYLKNVCQYKVGYGYIFTQDFIDELGK